MRGWIVGIAGDSQLPMVGDAEADAPRPVIAVGDSPASGYCELSGSGAPVLMRKMCPSGTGSEREGVCEVRTL